MVKAYYDTYKMPINITRCSNNYGPSTKGSDSCNKLPGTNTALNDLTCALI